MSESANVENTIFASPTKRFFVEMLTRDISLQDSILDLLDNCVDGISRTLTEAEKSSERPYEPFECHISFDKNSFRISDNCGGIPKQTAIEYAFRLGRPNHRDDSSNTVGIYGIGMKRAIFKMGKSALVESKHGNDSYSVEITPDWLQTEDNWELSLEEKDLDFQKPGTRITVKQLTNGTSHEFGAKEEFESELYEKISTHYTYILKKGFSITLNGKKIPPKPLTILASSYEDYQNKNGIMPYIYEGELNGVNVRLVVGFLKEAPDEAEIDALNEVSKRSSEDAGWTVITNERVVVYKDKTRLTGWGSGLVPNYHNQFITISGVVEFSCPDPDRLPLNTTKRGIEASDNLYLKIREYMMEGTRIFTQHTNHWKHFKREEEVLFSNSNMRHVRDVSSEIPQDAWVNPRNNKNERKFLPDLPRPTKSATTMRWIRFSKPLVDINSIKDYLDSPDWGPKEVGEACFDMILEDAKGDL